jgi:glycerol uptake facilitator-like aquaporin
LLLATPAHAHGGDYLFIFIALPLTTLAFVLAAIFAEAFADKRILSHWSWAGIGLAWVLLICAAFIGLSGTAWSPARSFAIASLLCAAPLITLFVYLSVKFWRKIKP